VAVRFGQRRAAASYRHKTHFPLSDIAQLLPIQVRCIYEKHSQEDTLQRPHSLTASLTREQPQLLDGPVRHAAQLP